MPLCIRLPAPKAPALLAFLLALLFTAGCGSIAVPGGPAGAVAVDQASALASVNSYRARNGLPALGLDTRLQGVAERHALAMASRGRMDHNLGGTPPSRVSAAGYNWWATAENLGFGYPSYEVAMRGWIASPAHRRNLLNPRVTELGVGAARDARGRLYWAQIFAAER